jgi:hypothetical protein
MRRGCFLPQDRAASGKGISFSRFAGVGGFHAHFRSLRRVLWLQNWRFKHNTMDWPSRVTHISVANIFSG